MTELDGLNGWERLDPALRAVATTRTNFSLSAIKLMREPFNDRRREAAERTDAQGLQIAEHTAQAEAASVPVRVYRGGHTQPARWPPRPAPCARRSAGLVHQCVRRPPGVGR